MIPRLFRMVAAVGRALPRGLLDFLVATVALRLGFFLHPVRRGVVLSNYRRILAFSGKDPSSSKLRALAGESASLYARLLISMLARPEDVEYARQKVDLELWPLLEEARSLGRGLVLALSNFGLFAHALMAMALRDIPLHVPILDRRTVAHLPHGWASRFLSVGQASRPCLRALSDNEVVVVLTMVNFLAPGPSVEFFGSPAALSHAAAGLAVAARAPILPAFSLSERGRCRVYSDGLIHPAPAPDAVPRTTELLARAQEKQIARHPAQWHVYEDFWDIRGMERKARLLRLALRWL